MSLNASCACLDELQVVEIDSANLLVDFLLLKRMRNLGPLAAGQGKLILLIFLVR